MTYMIVKNQRDETEKLSKSHKMREDGEFGEMRVKVKSMSSRNPITVSKRSSWRQARSLSPVPAVKQDTNDAPRCDGRQSTRPNSRLYSSHVICTSLTPSILKDISDVPEILLQQETAATCKKTDVGLVTKRWSKLVTFHI